MTPRIATELLAMAHGVPCFGDRPCFYCGASADDTYPLDLRSSFNDWWNVAAPSSTVICRGCALALDEKVPMPGRDKPQKRRSWSWLLTADRAVPLGDIPSIRTACLAPPQVPWSLSIAVSGQKHILFRTPANSGPEPYRVQFEAQGVTYTVSALSERLQLAKRIAAATGKPALTDKLGVGLYMRLAESCPEPEIQDWFHRAAEPINQLAAHLCPPKMECQIEYPATA